MSTMTGTWDGGRTFTLNSASGHTLVTDISPDHGGQDLGPSPMELVMLGLIGCTGVDVVSILEGMRQPLEGLTITATHERSKEHPKVFTAIHLVFNFRGDLEPRRVERAIKLSESKYCSVSAMLGHTASITHEITIEP
jgi:putative redox protein